MLYAKTKLAIEKSIPEINTQNNEISPVDSRAHAIAATNKLPVQAIRRYSNRFLKIIFRLLMVFKKVMELNSNKLELLLH